MTADEAATIERWHRENTYQSRIWDALDPKEQDR